jgi:hypothetical protein
VSSVNYFLQPQTLATSEYDQTADGHALAVLLRAAGERSLSCGAAPVEVYRLTWMHSFVNTEPVVVRFVREGHAWTATAEKFQSRKDLTTPIRINKSLSATEAQKLEHAISVSGFWMMPNPVPDADVFDGAVWILEGRRDNQYHVVRRLGQSDNSIRVVALTLMQLANVRKPEQMR